MEQLKILRTAANLVTGIGMGGRAIAYILFSISLLVKSRFKYSSGTITAPSRKISARCPHP